MIPNDAYPQLAPYTNSELRLWLNQQLPSGQWVSNPQSGFYDETAILISAALDAYRVTGKRALLAEALPRLRRGWAWLRSNASGRESTHLLWTPMPEVAGEQRPVASVAVDCADQVARRNYPAQVNLLWLRATQSMSIIESMLGNAAEARRDSAFAAGIQSDFNQLFWSDGAIHARNAAPAAPFGHYRSWYPSDRDYFELDSNFQAIIYGAADEARTASMLSFVTAHETYLLGSASGAPPAKIVYGDYEPADYAQIRNKIGDGVYQNAYWPSVGGLAALAYQHAGQGEVQLHVLDGLAAAFRAGQATHSASEWYDISGRPGGVSSYQWSARSFINVLYHAYLGVDDDWTSVNAENLRVLAPGGEAIARLRHLGKWLTIHTHGRGRVERVLVDGNTTGATDLIPEALLHDESVINVYTVE
jgi:glycogen debranching enzyme